MGTRDRNQSSRGVDAIYHALRDRIALLDYPPGAMLSENALAEDFGVSRTPIRQALQRLEFEGLVVSRHGVGTMVTTVDLQYLREVYALRLKLIDIIGELSTGRVSSEVLATLQALVTETAELRTSEPRPRELARLYMTFNEELSAAVGNKPLREIADRFFYQTARVWLQLLPQLDWRNEVDQVVDEAEGVITALRQGDMSAMAKVRAHHMRMCMARIDRAIGGDVLSVPVSVTRSEPAWRGGER